MKSAFKLILALAVAFIMLTAPGCTKTIYQPMESVVNDSLTQKTETDNARFQMLIEELRHSVNIRDSIIIRDSVVMVINEAGDVINKESFHNSDRNHYKEEDIQRIQAKYDSLFQAQRNEFSAILEKLEQTPVPVERELTAWEKLKQEVGGIAIGLVIAVICAAMIWLIRKSKRKQLL